MVARPGSGWGRHRSCWISIDSFDQSTNSMAFQNQYGPTCGAGGAGGAQGLLGPVDNDHAYVLQELLAAVLCFVWRVVLGLTVLV